MFIEESLWVKAILSNLELLAGSAILDVGSSTTQFRQLEQPHIDNNVFYPLRQRGCQIYYMDSKQGDGVDIVCDISDSNIDPLEYIGMQFDLVICSNLLEHVMNINRAARITSKLVKTNGYLLVTVPRLYRKHLDPIDTMFRPSLKKLEILFQSVESTFITLASKVIRIDDQRYYPKQNSRWLFWGYRDVVRYLFLWRRWKVSCLLLNKKVQHSLR